ncbi:MAG TPA: 1-deoxy-D-xylulose-5-phosphate reductoisomerase [Coriobacteriia bacterium]
MTQRRRVAILGSTGSIGRQALDIAARYTGRIEVVSLAARSNAVLVADQARAFGVRRVCLVDPAAAAEAREWLPEAQVLEGAEALAEMASAEDADIVLNALVGAAGLRASMSALAAGKRLALANKESLVTGGELVMSLAGHGELLPVDSEHSAIFQCLVGELSAEVSRIWLTASGGPFRGFTRRQLETATREQALAHPRWTMGPKITIDSATLMNKGLEAIEAHHLFDVDYEQIRIVVHPQSTIHSMVEFADGSVKAHLGATDMRVPIQYALSYPERWDAPVPPLDFGHVSPLGFEEPDAGTFRCLTLALEAGRTGGSMPAAMNAANEVAVAAFLEGRCRLTDIDRTVEAVMTAHDPEPLESVEQVEAVDAWARERAREFLGRSG